MKTHWYDETSKQNRFYRDPLKTTTQIVKHSDGLRSSRLQFIKQSKHASKTAQHHHQHPSLISLDKTTKIITANYCHKCYSSSHPTVPELLDLTFPQPPQESSHTLQKHKKIPNKNLINFSSQIHPSPY